jgi:hypothetical protein
MGDLDFLAHPLVRGDPQVTVRLIEAYAWKASGEGFDSAKIPSSASASALPT